MDYEGPSRPALYNLMTISLDQLCTSLDEDMDMDMQGSHSDSSDSSLDSEKEERWKPTKAGHMIYHNIYTDVSLSKLEQMTIPRASLYHIEEMPMTFSVSTGVSYLSAQLCPIKA